MFLKLDHEGGSRSLVIVVGLYGEDPVINPNAAKLDGEVKLFLQKGSDANTLQEMCLGDNQTSVASVSGGSWRSQAWDLNKEEKEGYDTLVAECSGTRVNHSLLKQQLNNQQQPSQQRQQQSPKTVIEVSTPGVVPMDEGKKCNITLNGIIWEGTQPKTGSTLDFYFNGEPEPTNVVTDHNGRFSFTFAGKPASGEPAKLDIQIHGGLRRAVDVKIPAAPKADKAANVVGISVTNAQNNIIWCKAFKATLNIQTKFEEGKPGRTVNVFVSCDKRVNFANAATGDPIGDRTSSCTVSTKPDGTFHLYVDFLACEADSIVLQISVPETSHSLTVTLKYKTF